MASAKVSENKVISIRALGKDGGAITHYVATEDSPMKRNVFSFRVNETEEILEIYEDINVNFGIEGSPSNKYKASGGLKQHYEPMVVSLRNGEKLFTVGIQKVELESAYFVNYQQMIYDYYYIAEEKEHEIIVRFTKDRSKDVRALIRAKKQCSSVIVTIYGELPMIEILALTMAGFKHFYCFFKLHFRPIAAHIPGLMTLQQWQRLFDMQPMSTIHHLILRASCQVRNGAKYLELLHGQTKQVVMVIAHVRFTQTDASNNFLSPNDKLVFKSRETEDQSGNISTEVSTRGHIRKAYVENGKFIFSVQRMYEKPSENLPLITEIFEMGKITPSARISEGENKSSIIVKVIELSEVANNTLYKYMLLAHATNIAIRHYKLLDCCLPFFDEYPFCK